MLESDPAAVRELAELLDEVNPGWRGTAGQAPAVSNTISGGTFHSQIVQGHDFGDITFHQPSPPQRHQ